MSWKELDKKINELEKSETLYKMAGIPEEPLKEALVEVTDLNKIFNSRFKNFQSVQDRKKFPIELVVEEFITHEICLARIIYQNNIELKTAGAKYLVSRVKEYVSLAFERKTSGKEKITNTFLWEGLHEDRKKALAEIERLYNGLRGVNQEHYSFLANSVSLNEFIALFTGSTINRKIHWIGSVSILIYLMDFIADAYVVLPNHLEDAPAKELNEWVAPKMVDCFVYGSLAQKEFTRAKIATNRDKLKKTPAKITLIKEIIDTITV